MPPKDRNALVGACAVQLSWPRSAAGRVVARPNPCRAAIDRLVAGARRGLEEHDAFEDALAIDRDRWPDDRADAGGASGGEYGKKAYHGADSNLGFSHVTVLLS